MQFSTVTSFGSRKSADVLVIPFFKTKKGITPAADFDKNLAPVKAAIGSDDFKGKDGEVLILYAASKHEKRIALLGLGDETKLTVEKLRRSYGALTKACNAKKIKAVNILVPHIKSLSEGDIVRGLAEGMLLANYAFTGQRHISLKHDPIVLIHKVFLIGTGKAALAEAEKAAKIFQGVYLARNLVNGNADDITPQYLGHVAEILAKKHKHLKVKLFSKKEIEKEKMGLLLAVNRGSSRDPAFIVLNYTGNPKSTDKTVIVGKGITFDTGGLNLKPTGGMETMRADMGGAAVVLGTIEAIANLGLKVNVTGVIPSTENAMGPNSYKPGDVYPSYSGRTVEIGNTDAEGRLVLADALSYAVKELKPSRMIDFATLTGAIDVALGNEASGLMSNNEALAESLLRSGAETFERAWRMPLFEEYREQLRSDIADIKNTGGRGGGSNTAAKFLQEFVGEVPWAHFDIASTSFLNDPKRYLPKFATGVGVRLMVNFLENLSPSK